MKHARLLFTSWDVSITEEKGDGRHEDVDVTNFVALEYEVTWRKEMNARKPAEKRKRTLRQWGFLSIHVVSALWAAIVA